jgi:hypothetical protein
LHLLLPAGFYRRFLCVCLRLIFHEDPIFFNGRPLASLARLTQTISGRPGRISFPLLFGQI